MVDIGELVARPGLGSQFLRLLQHGFFRSGEQRLVPFTLFQIIKKRLKKNILTSENNIYLR